MCIDTALVEGVGRGGGGGLDPLSLVNSWIMGKPPRPLNSLCVVQWQ